MKYLFILLTVITSISYTHADSAVQSQTQNIESRIENIKESTDAISKNIDILNSQINKLKTRQENLSPLIDRNYKLQNEINSTASKLINIIKNKEAVLKPISIELIKPTNWFIYILPITTIFIVIGGTFLSIKTITIKSKESIDALEKSNKTNIKITMKNIQAEQSRLEKSIISNNRQTWINTLRDEVSLLMSFIAKSTVSTDETIMENLWLHFYKIQLLLNPDEEDHNNLLAAMRGVLKKMIKKESFEEDLGGILNISKLILIKKWKRLKEFEQ